MKQLFTHLLVGALPILLGWASALPTFAQGGKTGTTITLDGNSCRGLFSQDANTNGYELYGYIRHKQAPVQVVSSNKDTIDTAGLFTDMDNNILFATDGTLMLCRGSAQDITQTASGYTSYFGIIAPKGYRIIQMTLDVDVTSTKTIVAGSSTSTSYNKTPNGVVFKEYTYNDDGSTTETGKSLTIDTSKEQNTLDITKSEYTNKIYLSITTATSTNTRVVVKSLKIIYAIDEPFTQAMPNTEGGTTIHTDMIDLGTFYDNGDTWAYNTSNASDFQEVSLYTGSDATNVSKQDNPAVVTVNNGQYFVTASNGHYYVEAPEKFRILGAKLNFLRSDATGSKTDTTYTDATSITSGGTYIITDGNGHYLNLSGSSLVTGTNPSTATKWTVTKSGSSYTIKSGSYYLALSSSNTLTVSTNSDTWSYSSSNGFFQTSNFMWNTTYYYLSYNSSWTVSTSSSSTKAKLQVENINTTGNTSYKGGDFTATVYNRDNSDTATDGIRSLTSEDKSASISISDFNNDAIHFEISGLTEGVALYNVELQLLPLDPEVQRMDVAYKTTDGIVSGNTSVTSENYVMATNQDRTAYVAVPEGQSEYQIVFRNAVNEQPSHWYTDGSKNNNENGYSNYFLVNSAADIGGETNVNLDVNNNSAPTARVDADEAGTSQLAFTNIEEFERVDYTGNPTELKYIPFDKKEANYGQVKLSLATGSTQTDSKTVYVYTADQPTFNIMPTGTGIKHIDYRYYSITVAAITKMTPKIEVEDILIYSSTLKGVPHKKSSTLTRDEQLDETHRYVGLTVKATIDGKEYPNGVLASKDIIEAIRTVLKDYNDYCGFGSKDPFRGILYLDMSGLKSSDNTYLVSFNDSTADNCLYFMYPGYIAKSYNVITKQTDGTFGASSNIIVYDQQPFFTPYAFSTGQYTATYERESTHGKAMVQQMSTVLPFNIDLDADGHPKSTSDKSDEFITFRTITKAGEVAVPDAEEGLAGYAYAVVAAVTDHQTAQANTPYYITTSNEEGGFTFNITNAQFEVTPKPTVTGTGSNATATEQEMTGGSSLWTSYGTYSGQVINKANDRFILASKTLRKTGAQKQNDVAYILPFRAYFVTTDNVAAKANTFAIVTDQDVITSISDVNTQANPLTVQAGQGCIEVTAGSSATRVHIYHVSGQQVADAPLAAGESACYGVAQGAYIVNGIKVIVK